MWICRGASQGNTPTSQIYRLRHNKDGLRRFSRFLLWGSIFSTNHQQFCTKLCVCVCRRVVSLLESTQSLNVCILCAWVCTVRRSVKLATAWYLAKQERPASWGKSLLCSPPKCFKFKWTINIFTQTLIATDGRRWSSKNTWHCVILTLANPH